MAENTGDKVKKPAVSRKWETMRFRDGLYGCVLKVREDGKDDNIEKTTGSVFPDLDGNDVTLIVNMVDRFGFNLRGLVDECRSRESLKLASERIETLNRELQQ